MGDARRRLANPGAHVLVLTWLGGLLRRRTGRLIGQSAGVALAVLLLAALGTFFTSSRATMTTQAVRAVPVDWQVQLSPGSSIFKASATVAATRGGMAGLPRRDAGTPGPSPPHPGPGPTTGPGAGAGAPTGHE